MSRLKLRKERNCLNCHTEVLDRYCHVCGQENIEPKESVWHLVLHFFKDITHFDGKFFNTIKYLFTKPGFLSTAYMIGQRASYVNPIRLYIFTSAFFFLIFFSMNKIDRNSMKTGMNINGKTYAQIEAMDSLAFDALTRSINKEAVNLDKPMTRAEFKKYFDSAALSGTIHFTNSGYQSKAEYDSVLASGKKKDNWLKKQMVYREIEINQKYRNRDGDFAADFANAVLHNLPKIFFVLLPLFALILKLLYIRRKDYYYVNHVVFTIHFYILLFLMMLLILGLSACNNWLHWNFIKYIQIILGVGIFFYLYKAMRKFYGQSRIKTIFKYLAICFLLFICVIIVLMIFIAYSVFNI